jgi:hypothetical protein
MGAPPGKMFFITIGCEIKLEVFKLSSINILYIIQHGSRMWFSESVLFVFLFNIYS